MSMSMVQTASYIPSGIGGIRSLFSFAINMILFLAFCFCLFPAAKAARTTSRHPDIPGDQLSQVLGQLVQIGDVQIPLLVDAFDVFPVVSNRRSEQGDALVGVLPADTPQVGFRPCSGISVIVWLPV